ncbi:unnamed protein product [Adineta ricciae]|uniref:Uncharacterized protein n=1 Tax=Adineta ricciae TaxID=249248 RepID=A0A815D505_ADIRI|nr:unnamed protein product [Adineta ricciae]CAF1311284.1 unnamed protein product [Adineta ricciae]
MRLSIGFVLVFTTIAFVQSNPLFNQLALQPVLSNQFNGLQGLLPQYADLINKFQNLAQQAATNLTPDQLQTLAQQAFQLAQNVLSNQIDANTAASQLLNEVQQLLNLDGAGLTRPALSTRGKFNPFQGFFDHVQNAMNQFQNAAQQFANTFDPKKIEEVSKICFQLVESIINGQVDAKIAASELLLLIEQTFGSENGFVKTFVTGSQQLINFVSEILPHTQEVIGQIESSVNEFQNNVEHFANTLTFEQLQALSEVFSQLVHSVLSGKVEAKVAANELLLLIQQSFGTDNEYLNAFFHGAQQLINFVSDKLTRPANKKSLSLVNNVQGLLAQYGNVLSQFQGLAQQVTNALSQAQLQTLGQLAARLAQSVFTGQVDVNTAASQLLSQVQQYLGSNTELYNAVVNAVQQLVAFNQGH